MEMLSRLLDLAKQNGIAAVVVAIVWGLVMCRPWRLAGSWPRKAGAGVEAHPGPRGVVLVVEDEPGTAAALCRLLSDEFPGVEVRHVDRADDARKALLEGEPPRLALIDCYLPGGNGWELAKVAPRTTQVVLMSGAVDSELLPQLASGAAATYVAKPFDVDRLLTVVRCALATGQA